MVSTLIDFSGGVETGKSGQSMSRNTSFEHGAQAATPHCGDCFASAYLTAQGLGLGLAASLTRKACSAWWLSLSLSVSQSSNATLLTLFYSSLVRGNRAEDQRKRDSISHPIDPLLSELPKVSFSAWGGKGAEAEHVLLSDLTRATIIQLIAIPTFTYITSRPLRNKCKNSHGVGTCQSHSLPQQSAIVRSLSFP